MIQVKVKKVFDERVGGRLYKIEFIDGINYRDYLPIAYLEEPDHIYLKIIDEKMVICTSDDTLEFKAHSGGLQGERELIAVGKLYPEEYIDKVLKYIDKCCKHLKAVKEDIKEQKKNWHGDHTFTF